MPGSGPHLPAGLPRLESDACRGEVTQLQLLWQADQQPERAYKVFLQLLDRRDQVIAQRDAEPAGDSRPTTGWAPGETIYDNHGVLIPPGTPPGSYRRIVGLYDAETFERLRLPDGSDFVSLPPITVLRSQAPPPLEAFAMLYRQRFDFGAISLLGHDRYKRGFGHAPETPMRGATCSTQHSTGEPTCRRAIDWRFHRCSATLPATPWPIWPRPGQRDVPHHHVAGGRNRAGRTRSHDSGRSRTRHVSAQPGAAAR